MGLDTVVRVKKRKDPDKGLPMKEAVKAVKVSLKSDPGFYAVSYMTIARILVNIGKSAKWLSDLIRVWNSCGVRIDSFTAS